MMHLSYTTFPARVRQRMPSLKTVVQAWASRSIRAGPAFADDAKGRASPSLCRCCGCCALEEGEQLSVDQVRVGCGHSVRKVVIDLERWILE